MTEPAIDTLPVPTRAMAVGAHPDDADFWASGTCAKWIRAGCQVVYVVVTSGDKGSLDFKDSPHELAVRREAEQLAAARIIGVSEVVFLRHEDGTVQPTLELRGEIVHQIRVHQPEVVFTHDPLTRNYRMHADHRAVGQATLDAAFPAAIVPWCYPDDARAGIPPHRVTHALLFQADLTDYWSDISDTVDLKVQTIAAHASQIEPSFPGGADARVRQRAEQAALDTGLRYAEVFKRVDFIV